MDTTIVATLPPNTLGLNAFIFMALAWTCVLGLTLWSFRRLMTTPENETLPPPGSMP